MAKINSKVWLGFEDECISEKHKDLVDFTTNKIGGKPDWPAYSTSETFNCPLCQLPRPLVLQIYAPLENSLYHRTLYLFACINPNCWNREGSWCCIRMQTTAQFKELAESNSSKLTSSVTEWCHDADDWDDNNANLKEENGNIINNSERISDEDDESCSFDDSVRIGLGNLTVDDRNANTAAEAQGGAVGRLLTPAATAEIEGDEGEAISIDTPTMPQRNIISLLQEVTPLPQDLCDKTGLNRSFPWQFVPFFINVSEESTNTSNISDHVRELLQEYQQNNQDTLQLTNSELDSGGAAEVLHTISEKYEKSTPAHGDKMFYHFLTKVQSNPGQIIRYNRNGSSPLLLYPLQEIPKKCQNCQGDMIFEFQVLPTLIPKLKLVTDRSTEGVRLEFGTVLVFTCQQSCWMANTDFIKEVIVLQSES